MVPFNACPIRASLGIFGKKWTLLILRDIAFLKMSKFNQILKNNQGLSPRALSMRLRDLQHEELIEKIVSSEDGRDINYRLTRKGRDSIPILTTFIQFGMRHYAKRVFKDGKPRRLRDVFPERQPLMLGKLILAYADETKATPQ
jgi:DNA-binding HxlR family transcriptional regulator